MFTVIPLYCNHASTLCQTCSWLLSLFGLQHGRIFMEEALTSVQEWILVEVVRVAVSRPVWLEVNGIELAYKVVCILSAGHKVQGK